MHIEMIYENLWTTAPGVAALAIMVIGLLWMVFMLWKGDDDEFIEWIPGIALLIIGAIFAGAVMGAYDLPWIFDWFNALATPAGP
jgi:hypothetical protein